MRHDTQTPALTFPYGGSAAPALGGGSVIEPINLYLAGRAIAKIGDKAIPVEQFAVEGLRAWLSANLHALDAERYMFSNHWFAGSLELQDFFSWNVGNRVALTNDIAIGVALAP